MLVTKPLKDNCRCSCHMQIDDYPTICLHSRFELSNRTFLVYVIVTCTQVTCKWYFGCAVGSIDKLWFTAVWFTIYCNWFTAVAELQINAIASPLTDIIRFISHCWPAIFLCWEFQLSIPYCLTTDEFNDRRSLFSAWSEKKCNWTKLIKHASE